MGSEREIKRDELIRMAEETPAVVEWTAEKAREYREWWDSLTPEEQESWKGSPFT